MYIILFILITVLGVGILILLISIGRSFNEISERLDRQFDYINSINLKTNYIQYNLIDKDKKAKDNKNKLIKFNILKVLYYNDDLTEEELQQALVKYCEYYVTIKKINKLTIQLFKKGLIDRYIYFHNPPNTPLKLRMTRDGFEYWEKIHPKN